MATPVPLAPLFQEVHRASSNGDYDKALKSIAKILKEDANNVKALHCKAVCLMKENEFQAALDVINKISDSSLVTFEKAYCLYRLNRVDEALNFLKSAKGKDANDVRVQELLAQSYYRLEKYDEAYDVYLNLMKNTLDDYGDERETNLAAVVASLSLTNQLTEDIPDLGNQMYELCYNKACIDVGIGLSLGPETSEGSQKLNEAKEKLTLAEEECIKLLKEEEATDEDIDNELSIIRAQMGFVYQALGKENVATSLYNQVLKGKPDDSAVVSVVSNNVVCINRDQNVFDSKKKIKAALSEDAKLSSFQKKSISVNNALFLMLTGQNDSCRKQIKELKRKHEDRESFENAVLIESALFVREKKYKEAIECLKSVEHRSLDLSLVLAQILLNQGRIGEATQVLSSDLTPEESMRLGVISTVVSLLLSMDDQESVISTLKKAIKWHQTNTEDGDIKRQTLNVLYGEATKYLIKSNRAKEAVELLEQQRKLSKDSDPKVIAQLIAAYGQFDAKKAAEAMKLLPSIETIVKDVNVDALESSNWSLGAKYVKKAAKTDTPGGATDSEKKKKKKRRRKKILPKNYDPSVDPDPERWLPRWQRSTFKKKKDRRDRNKDAVGRGTQGAAVSDNIEVSAVKPSPRQQTTSPPSGPRGIKGGKKKKGGKR